MANKPLLKEADQDVLMLAGMVHGSLNQVDKMMEERSGIAGPINKLNLKAILRGDQNQNSYIPAVDPNVAKAYLPEEYVKSVVPDTSLFSNLENSRQLQNNSQQPSTNVSVTLVEETFSPKPQESSKIEQELTSIRNLLERINGNLTKMSGMLGKVFCSFNEKNKQKDSE